MPKPKSFTIEKTVETYLQQEKQKIKESTLSTYTTICENHILPYFQGFEIKNLTNEIINEFVKKTLKKELSPKRTNDIACLLLQIIKPYCNFEINIEKPSYMQKEITVFTESEYNKLKSYVSIGTDNRKLGIIIAMLTGIRLGELCALQWQNIDFKGNIIHIGKTIQRVKNTDKKATKKTKIIIDVPKSKSVY